MGVTTEMRVYIKNEKPEYEYPGALAEILIYLREHGELYISESSVEKFYREFSREQYRTDWAEAKREVIEAFADWLSEIDI